MLGERMIGRLGRLLQWVRTIPPDIPGKVAIAVVLTLALALMFPRGETIELEHKVGAVWAQKDLIAPFSFPVFRDEREYQRDVQEAKKKIYEVFERDTVTTDRQLGQLGRFFKQLTSALAARSEYRKSLHHNPVSATADSAVFGRLAASLDIPFSDREWDVLNALAGSGMLTELQDALTAALRKDLGVGILDRAKTSINQSEIALRKGSLEEIVSVVRFYDQNDIVPLLERQLQSTFRSDNAALNLGYKIGMLHIMPNIRFNPAATEQAAMAAADAVPRTVGFVQENERIVSKHERITQDIKLKLESLRRTRVERGAQQDKPSQLLGTFLHVIVVVLLYAIYLYLFRKRIVASNGRLALIALLILLQGGFAYLTREIDINAPLEFLILVPVSSMLLTILFDSRVGFYGTVVIAYLVAGIRGNDYSIALASLIAGALSVYTVRDMKNRTQIFRSLGYIFLGYVLAIVALALERYEPLGIVAEQTTYALVNAIVSPVLSYGLLIFVERVFRVTTDLTLLELAQYNHPLFRMLAERAPGTYHHSIIIAGLAEAGAAAVDANEVLARVGAYFHDIGKLVKPTYFVENQKGARNRHDKLAPRMSSLIIASHVKDGVALAREYKLPEEVIDFIPMHHGTTRIDFFFNKALQLAQNSSDETKIDEINEQDYRYPGPKPQTKETGIMMLADAIEAAIRSIDDPTPQRLEETINELIKKRFEEGELDECPLTLKDLTKIKAAFLTVMVGAYHARLKYPEIEKKKARRRLLATPGDSDSQLSPTTKEIQHQ
jgi:putative nucleotidyltransferase with HDIG domain